MLNGYFKCLPSAFGDLDGDVSVRVTLEESGEAVGLDDVARPNASVVGFIREPDRENTLFLWDISV